MGDGETAVNGKFNFQVPTNPRRIILLSAKRGRDAGFWKMPVQMLADSGTTAFKFMGVRNEKFNERKI